MNETRHWIPAVIALFAFSSFGCAAHSSKMADEQVRNLEREIARLKSERANLEARAGALDDKVVLLQTKLKKCATDVSPPLQIVKLTPSEGDEANDHISGEDTTAGDYELEPTETAGPKQKRPVLVLSERSDARVSSPPSQRRFDADIPLPSGFDAMGADNLGVVSKGSEKPDGAAFEMSLFNEAYRAYSNKQPEEALRGFADFIKSNPEHDFADDAVYWRGECYLTQGKFLHAIGEFERLVRRYPSSEKVSSGTYRIGFAYDKLRDYGKAYEYYFEVVEKFPGTDAARRAGSRVAEIKNSMPMGEALLPTSAPR